MRQFLAVLALAASALAQVSAPEGSIEDFVESEMPASGVPGLAYAVVADGEITVGVRGTIDTGSDQLVTPDTPFLIGSITKSVTALAVMQLVEAGDLELDAELSQYLAGFSGSTAGTITIQQLLSHTSGFSTLQGNVSHTDATEGQDELERRVDALNEVDPAYAPGQRWEYSNTNYEILGRLVEVVSGQEFQAYVEANILEPVGMENSFVADGEVHDSMATGHRPWFGTKRPLSENRTHRGTAPQGGVVASAEDVALYLRMMMNGEDDVLSAEGKALMLRPASDTSWFYGFGWFVDSDNESVWHDGLSPGFQSLATMVPSERTGVVVLVNANSGVGFGDTTQLRNGIAARALGFDYDGEGSSWSLKALFLSLVLLPVFYLISIVWAWRYRDAIRAKEGISGLFSLWFPLLTTLAAAIVMLWLMPKLLGAPLATLNLFQPDLGLVLISGAILGVLWAVFRLGVAYTGKPSPT